MKITNIEVRKLDTKNNLKAFVNVEIEKALVVKGIKVVDGRKGLFISMPNEKSSDGYYYDIIFPITKEFREELSEAVLDAYDEADEPKKNRRK